MKAWLAILLLITVTAIAAGPSRSGPGDAGENRFPQPVRVGSLIGHKLIGPTESQPLLGYVEAVERVADRGLALRVKLWSLLPWGGRSVAIPLDAVSFLGPQVVLTGLNDAQLAALPTAPAPTPVATDEIIQVGIVKPFH